MGGTLRVGATGGGAQGHDRRAQADGRHGHHALLEPLRVAGRADAGLLRAPDAARRVDRGEQERRRAGTIRLKPDLTFHNGKPVTADDVIFSLQRITDPKDPKVGAASINYVDVKQLKKMDDRTVRIPLQFANAGFPDDLGQYFNAIVPTDYDPESPVGTGPVQVRLASPPASRAPSRSSPTTGRAASPTSTSSSSSTSRTTRRASTRCSAARSTRSTTCPRRRSRASRRTGNLRVLDLRDRRVAAVHDARRRRRRSTTCACGRRSG